MVVSTGAEHKYFNPLPLYRGRRQKDGFPDDSPGISIHFLYTEEDEPSVASCAHHIHFNPLPLYRGRHCQKQDARPTIKISIHFLYTEEDRKYQQMNILHQDILYLILT